MRRAGYVLFMCAVIPVVSVFAGVAAFTIAFLHGLLLAMEWDK